jgi:hypothetical protein
MCIRLVLKSASLASVLVGLGLLGQVADASDDGLVVEWQQIVGLMAPGELVGRRPGKECNAGGVECLVGTPAPWITRQGRARVDLDDGELTFFVRGLVIGGDPSFANIGTTSVVTQVKGTLVCNDTGPGRIRWVDTDAVPLSPGGNADFRGHVSVPMACLTDPADTVFLVRIAEVGEPMPPITDLWNAFGAYRTIRPSGPGL